MRDVRIGPNKAGAVIGIFSAVWFPISVASWLQLWWPEHRWVGWVGWMALLGLWVGGRWEVEARKWRVFGLGGMIFWVSLGPLFLWLPMLRSMAGAILCVGAVGVGVAWGGAWRELRGLLGEIWSGEMDLGEVPFSWKGLLWLIFLLLLPFFFRPYMGRLGLHFFLALVWGGYILRHVAYREHRPTRWFVFSWHGLTGGVLLFWMWSWPVPLADHEVLYASSVGGERVTLHARLGEGERILALVSQRLMLYQSIQAYRYSETLVHPAMAVRKKKDGKILLLGGEDGSILQELAKYPKGTEVVWVPLFSNWADFFRSSPYFREVHQKVHKHLRLKFIRISPFFRSFEWLQLLGELRRQGKFSLILADMPSPTRSLRMLFSAQSKKSLLGLLSEDGLLVESVASPYRRRRLYWCLSSMWSKEGGYVLPFQLAPSMINDHGFVWVRRHPFSASSWDLNITVPTRYLTPKLPFGTLMRFSRDVSPDGRDMQGKCFLPAM